MGVRVCLGGTFDPFHVGHERLFQRALQCAGPDGHVFIGLVSDAFSAAKRTRPIRPYVERKEAIEAWFAAQEAQAEVRVSPLDDAFGPSASGDYDVLVASAETVGTGDKINAARRAKGLAPLSVETVPLVLGADLLPVSATRVAAGLIDRDGDRLLPLKVAVGSANPVKVEAVHRAFARFLTDVTLDVAGHPVPSGVPEQPFDHETARGARARAEGALVAAGAGAEYGVGVEAGLMEDPSCADWLDVQHCVILDRTGLATHGHGSGFHYPADVVAEVRRGRTIGEVLGERSGDPDIGKTQGAIGWLTAGRLDRTTLTEQAVEAALVPRVRRDLYDSRDG